MSTKQPTASQSQRTDEEGTARKARVTTMGMYIEIEGEYPCGKCGVPLTGWQSKELRRHGLPVDPAAQFLDPITLAPGMDGEIHNSHDDCGFYTEYPVTDGALGVAKDRRATWDEPLSAVHAIAPESPLGQRLNNARGRPVIVEANGIRYHVTPESPWAFYDPERARAAVEQSAGIFTPAGVDGAQLLRDLDRGRGLRYDDVRQMVREAKPAALPTDYGAETRYGRESHGNARYNAALDDYEAALLKRLAADEAEG